MIDAVDVAGATGTLEAFVKLEAKLEGIDVAAVPPGLTDAIVEGATTAEELPPLLTGATLVGVTLLALGVIGLTTRGALTAVVPLIVAPVTLVRGATVRMAAGATIAPTLGFATTGPLFVAAACVPVPLLAAPRTRARIRPIIARQSKIKHNHQGQPPFPSSFSAGGGLCLFYLDIIELASQDGPLTVSTIGSFSTYIFDVTIFVITLSPPCSIKGAL